jgi:hypothetical protein
MNLVLLCAMLIIASPHITFASFMDDLGKNIGNFSQVVVDLAERFARGAQH